MIKNSFEKKQQLLEAEDRITYLLNKSSYFRHPVKSECIIKNEQGEELEILIYKNGNDPRLSKVQELFNQVFRAGEIEPEDILRCAVDGLTPWGTQDTKYKVIGIYDNEGFLLSICSGTTLFTEKEHIIHCVEYIATNPLIRKGGLARESYISALMDAIDTAKSSGKLFAVVGECTDSSETFWNSVGWRKIYAKNKSSETYMEIPYIQPALEYNTNTGNPSNNADEIKEHLMLDFFSYKPTKVDIIDIYETIIKHTAEWPREAFSSEEAHQNHLSYLNSLKKDFIQFVNSCDEIIYLNAEERKTKKIIEG